MSLTRKNWRNTEKRQAALKENRKHAHGPATRAGRERIRAAKLRHGYYSKAEDAALRALGEDPADFRRLREGLQEKATSADTLREQIAERLARALWRMRRADRMQEGYALRQAREEGFRREGHLHMQMMRVKMVAGSWQRLAQSVADDGYVTTRTDLDSIRQLHKEGMVQEASEVALALFYEMREPGTLGPGDPGFQEDEQQAQCRAVLHRIREIFGLGPEDEAPGGGQNPGGAQGHVASGGSAGPAGLQAGDAPCPAEEAGSQPDVPPAEIPESSLPCCGSRALYPDITEAQWEAREPVRQLLENILARQVEIFETQHHDLMRQWLSGPSPQERAAEIVPSLPHMELMQKMEAANFRQVARMTSLLIRLRRQELQMENDEESKASERVIENK